MFTLTLGNAFESLLGSPQSILGIFGIRLVRLTILVERVGRCNRRGNLDVVPELNAFSRSAFALQILPMANE